MSWQGRLAKLDLEELRNLNHLVVGEINARLQEEGQEIARALKPGDRIYFEHGGERVDGVLQKIAVKNARVEIEETRNDGKVEVKTWQVPTALLRKAEKSRKPQRKKVPKRRREVRDSGEL